MTLYERIRVLYPTLTDKDFVDTIRLRDDSDGRGEYIHEWNHPSLTRPTDKELA